MRAACQVSLRPSQVWARPAQPRRPSRGKRVPSWPRSGLPSAACGNSTWRRCLLPPLQENGAGWLGCGTQAPREAAAGEGRTGGSSKSPERLGRPGPLLAIACLGTVRAHTPGLRPSEQKPPWTGKGHFPPLKEPGLGRNSPADPPAFPHHQEGQAVGLQNPCSPGRLALGRNFHRQQA